MSMTVEQLTPQLEQANKNIAALRDRAAKAVARVDVLKEQVASDANTLREAGIDPDNLDELLALLAQELDKGQQELNELLLRLEGEVQTIESTIAEVGTGQS